MPFLKEEFDWVENRYKEALGLVQQGVQTVDKAIDENIPGGEQFTERWATGVQRIGSFVQGEMDAADRQVDDPIDHVGDIPYFLFGAYRRGAQQYTNNARNLATQMGVDPRAGNVLGMAAEIVAEAGLGGLGKAASKITPPGPGLKPAVAGASSAVPTPGVVTPPSNVAPITIKNPDYLAPGVSQGIAKTQANRTARDYLDQSLARLDKRRKQLEADVKSGKVEYKSKDWFRLDKKIREERYGELSSFYNRLEQDLPAYRKKGQRHEDPTGGGKYLEQHHLAAKAQTAPFIEAIMRVGDADDLVALHEYSRMLGVFMGNGKINMLDAPGPIHRAAAARTAKEKAGNIHSAFSAVGLEKSNAYVTDLLKDAATSDEVMEVFTKYAQEHIIPQQDIAKKIVKQYFDEYRVDLTPSQRAAFDKLVQQANRGT